MWMACENTDDLPYVLKHVGEECLMIGTDYGHHDPSTCSMPFVCCVTISGLELRRSLKFLKPIRETFTVLMDAADPK
jgi:hypothetical protein